MWRYESLSINFGNIFYNLWHFTDFRPNPVCFRVISISIWINTSRILGCSVAIFYAYKSVILKLFRGEELFGLHARSAPEIPPPPQSDFSPPGHDFCLTLGILLNFFLFLSLGWPSLQGGELPPPLRSSAKNFPLPLPRFYAYVYLAVKLLCMRSTLMSHG